MEDGEFQGTLRTKALGQQHWLFREQWAQEWAGHWGWEVGWWAGYQHGKWAWGWVVDTKRI